MLKFKSKDSFSQNEVRSKFRILGLLSRFFISLGVIFVVLSLLPFLYQEITYYFPRVKNQRFILLFDENGKTDPSSVNSLEKDSPFARLLSTRPIFLTPVNTEFSLVIEKIGVNVPVIKDVEISDKDSYMNALEKGVAHAAISDYPSTEPGNVYIFAHASINFWRLGKYATVFNLLRHLDLNDTIHVFYDGRHFVYKVIAKERYKNFDTYPITRPVLEPLLTLQTCDPPGTTLNRLVVTAKLVEVD